MGIIVKCPNGHHFDQDKYNVCPYCIREAQKAKNRAMGIKTQREGFDDALTVGSLVRNETIHISSEGKRGHVYGGGTDEERTIGELSSMKGTAYVAGWLVAVEGPQRGRDYRIVPGNNWLGSGYRMDICIQEDIQIAEEKHCQIIYEPRHNRFYVLSGVGDTYLNEKYVLKDSQMELHLGDVLQVGSSKLEFIPFCREGHTWN